MNPLADTIYIRYGSQLVATLDADCFRYESSWRNHQDAFPLSQNLDLDRPKHAREIAWRWLVNLLPEGPSRQRIAQRLRISSENDLALILALGQDCAGAITIHAQKESLSKLWDPEMEWAPYKKIGESLLRDIVTTQESVATLLDREVRLSLAGAQDKIAVRLAADQSLLLPLNGAPSTHLLKCPGDRFSNLVDNEYLCLELARAIDLPVVRAHPLQVETKHLLLIERFDRSPPIDPSTFPPAPKNNENREHPRSIDYEASLQRLHQEDFAQALDKAHFEKYESDGGPTFAECLMLVRNTARNPISEINTLMRWFVFCLIIGNRDNHAKNLARIWGGEYWILAPFYDLVCTTTYRGLSQNLSMSIGGVESASRLSKKVWAQHAKTCKIGIRQWIKVIEETADGVEHTLPEVLEQVTDTLGANRLGEFQRAIQKGIRNIRRSIET